jgi:DNA repair protein RecN (Recombination protein N)
MLNALSIKNIVLIDQLDLELANGLSVLTGETGAGKSILLDALTLALGGRGDSSLVRKGEQSGSVVAEVFLPLTHPAQLALKEAEVEVDEQLILKRVQYIDGRTRAFINDQAVSASLMKKVGSLIVEIHGQHDDRALVDGETHRNLLDEFGGHEKMVFALVNAYQEYEIVQVSLEKLRQKIAKAASDEEYAKFAVEELSSLAVEKGEEEVLSKHRQTLMQLEKIAGEVSDADEILNGSSSPSSALALLMRRLARKDGDEAGLFSPVLEALDASLVALDNTVEALENLKREMEFEPSDLENTEERLFALRAMARKHECLCDELPQILEQYKKQLEEIHNNENALAELELAEKKAHEVYIKTALILSGKRKKTALELENAVNKELPDLKLGAAKFIVEHIIKDEQISPNGYDFIAFHVQTNPGTSAGPIMKVASGGELSRFLLALKVVLADRGSAPVLIFDEIDSGVGGAVADAIGRRLARLSQKVQLISVTHAPQVAARAKSHLLIEKLIDEKSKTVRTFVRELDAAQKSEEIARMLAGANITDEARAAAKRLISEVE